MHPNLDLVCNGNPDARVFFLACGEYLRAADNLMDEGPWDEAAVLNCVALGVRLYSTPFYIANKDRLQLPVLTATSIWAKSCQWEREPELWKRQWADVLRHIDCTVYGAVAMITGGWEKLHVFTGVWLSAGYVNHKDKHGTPDEPKP